MSETKPQSQPTDLLKKLRARVQHNHAGGDKWAVIPDPLCQAAADEIEKMQVIIECLGGEMAKLKGVTDGT